MTSTEMSLPRHRKRLADSIHSRPFQYTILALIVINAVVLGLETSGRIMATYGPLLIAIDTAILAVFVAELALRIYTFRLAFFRDP